jgi:hypothetical protein
MVISRDWIIGSSGDSGANHEVAMGDAEISGRCFVNKIRGKKPTSSPYFEFF